MTTLYLRSRTDRSVQPYGVRLPQNYSPKRKYPLVIQLHGLNFNEVLSGSRLRYGGLGNPQWVQPDLPVIYASCFGRPSAFYCGMGEEDVLEVLEEVQVRFPVDKDRVYIMGHSMGGCGSF
jgi:predicted peptidase